MPDITPVIQGNTLNLSARQLKMLTREAGAEWSDDLINDYLGQINGLLLVSGNIDQIIPRIESLELRMNVVEGRLDVVEIRLDGVELRLDVLEPRVDQNEIDIATNATNIATNATNIATNASNIATNTSNITSVTNNFNAHNSSSSQHGVTGNNVGTGDFCTTSVGGVVELMALVSDAIQSTQTIVLPDIAAAPATYDQAHIQTLVDMANDTKAKHNQLVTDFNNAVTQLNELIANSKTAKQMSTV